MTAPMTTDRRANCPPPGPDPNTTGIGPMKMTPPVETFPWLDDPSMTKAAPARIIRSPTPKSLRKLYTLNKSRLRTTMTMARIIAMLVHFASEPNAIGIGPISTTPAPLTSPPELRWDANNATTTTASPARMRRNPTVVISNNDTEVLKLDKCFWPTGLARFRGPWPSTATARSA
jgi:hypothetical protein